MGAVPGGLDDAGEAGAESGVGLGAGVDVGVGAGPAVVGVLQGGQAIGVSEGRIEPLGVTVDIGETDTDTDDSADVGGDDSADVGGDETGAHVVGPALVDG